MSDEWDGFTPELTAFVDEVETYWSARGMLSMDRRRLAAELQSDLGEAIQIGASPHELIRQDVGQFAQSVAAANGIDLHEPAGPEPLTIGALVRTGLLGGLAGAFVAYLLIYQGATYALLGMGAGPMPELVAVMILHACAAMITIAGMITAMRWRFKHDPNISRIVVPAGLLIALAGVASVAPIMVVAAATNYSTAPIVLIFEIAIAATFCGVGIATAAKRRLRQA